nr:putative ribonuclease H-like domain-containing protein [Tanacetum cinerariifolium]
MDLQDKGVIDSRCSRHITGNMSYLTDYKEIDEGYVAFGGNPKGEKIIGRGTIKTGKLDFKNVYFVRELKFNHFSVLQMCDKKNSVLFNDTECIVLSPNFKLNDESRVLLKVPRKKNMYSVDLKNIVPKEGLTCLFAKATSDESKLWHRRLGHLNFKTMNKLVKRNLVRGLPSKLFENNQDCVACQKGKQHRASCKSKVENSTSLPLHLLHMDWFGLTFVKSLMKKMYCLVVTNDYSRFTWVFFLASKDETSAILKTFIIEIENLVDHKVKVIRCDNGTEFKNREMNQFCEIKGIMRQYSVARTPQQNRVAERRNMTLIEAVRTMLADLKLPTTFWAEPVNTVFYVKNRVLVVKPHNKPIYELFHSRTSALSFIRPFGCHVTILNTKDHLGKFDGSGSNLIFDIDALTKLINYKPIVAGNQSNSTACTKACDDAGKARMETVPGKDYILLPLWTADLLISQESKSSQDDGFQPSSDDGKKYRKRAIGTKWVFRNKKDERGIVIRNKERLVTQGHTQEEGRDYDEVCAHVTRIEAIRLFLAYTSFKDFVVYQMDVKSAFLYEKIEEEVYVCQTLGFEDSDFPNKVYKVEKALYGLHQAPRAWYETLSTYVLDNGFHRGKINKTLFIRRYKDDILLIQVYVDDIIFGSTKKEFCNAFKKMMHEKFQMKVKNASTLIETQKPLLKDEDGEKIQHRLLVQKKSFLLVVLDLSKVILNGDSPSPIRVVDGVIQAVAPTTAKQRLAKKNELKARDQILDDQFNSLKIYEAEVKSSSSTSPTTQNIAFVSSQNTDSTNESVSVVASVSATSTKVPVFALPNVDNLRDGPQMADGHADHESKELDWSFQAYKEPTNYALMAFTSSSSTSFSGLDSEVAPCSKACSKAYATLPSHYDNLTNDLRKSRFDVLSYKISLEYVEARFVIYQQNENVFEEDIKLLKLDVMLRDNTLVKLRKKFEKDKQERDELKLKLEKIQISLKNLSKLLASQITNKTGLGYDNQVFNSTVFDSDELISFKSDVSMPTSLVHDRYKSGEGYHVVPPPYIGTFMAPKPDLVFHDAPTISETIPTVINVEPSTTKSNKDLS